MEEDYQVEAIRKWRYNYKKKTKEYFIKWLNYDEDVNTWEPEEHLSCPELLKTFVSGLSQNELKYFHSNDPDKLTGFQRNAEYIACVGADSPHESDGEESDKVNKQKFYVLILFEDSDLAEEVTVKEFFKYKQDEAFAFFEKRILVEDNTRVGEA